MALKFVDEPPKAKRGPGSAGNKYLTEEVQEELKANPNKWALVAEGVTTAQSIATFVKDNGGRGKPWDYTSRNTGKTVENRNSKEVPTYDVYVTYKP
jgi:hypothetical protein